ncbi:threonine synthase [Sphingomonas ginkgonis]|uniref:Threonine synthase n=1 Tax=Sphingomonas ginkgonis TaxID=2315330 RepID=A0A3R9Z4D6_9SPHN|nr:threonine synthase [Sphingomonas ginkgonis]RST29530.1 threonine synthase [Sphingomonas ginkgonis]
MKFVSTRGSAPPATLSQAIRHGAAPDGGLYMPERIPAPDWSRLDPDVPLAAFAAEFLKPWFAGDALESELPAICAEAFDFPVPLVAPDPAQPSLSALELFHGPTGAFKDFGARFLLACFDRIGDRSAPLHVLVATSGDTGGAVGCAAEGRSAVRATILFPRGRVSSFQEKQLTCWGEPVDALEVDGDFDDCQRLVKAAFNDRPLSDALRLTSANSINIGRLLPQAAYAAHAVLQSFTGSRIRPGVVAPSGNLGQGFSFLLARTMGAPVGPLLLATNANRTLRDWYENGRYEPRASVATLANAMDVGAPSNFERLVALPIRDRGLRVELVDDGAITRRIRADFEASGYIWCPHSACAAEAYARLSEAERADRPWLVAATAHPFKFADVIEPITGAPIAAPPALAAIEHRPTAKRAVPARLDALVEAIEGRVDA